MYKGEDGKIYWGQEDQSTREVFERALMVHTGCEVFIEQVLATIGGSRKDETTWWKRIEEKMKAQDLFEEGQMYYDWTDHAFGIRRKAKEPLDTKT